MKNIANYITISRIILSIILFFLNIYGMSFYIIYILCGLTDILDGFIARNFKIESIIGQKLDSIADIVFVLISLIKILPIMVLNKYIYICLLIIIIVKSINYIYGYIKYKKIIMLHTKLNKITGLILFITPLLLNYFNNGVIFKIDLILAISSSIDELIRIKKGIDYGK